MSYLPFISVVIPAFNSESYIGDLFQGILNQSFPEENFEIIVVDNGSTDNTYEISSRFADTVIRAPHCATVAEVRNEGVRHCKGELLGFLDSDCVPDKDWLQNAARAFMDGERVFGNKVGVPNSAGWIERAWFINRHKKAQETNYINSANLFMAKSVYIEVGGFDENLVSGEDYDICKRSRENDISVRARPDINVVHLKNPTRLLKFLRREMWHGVGSLQAGRKAFKDKPFLMTLLFISAIVALFVGVLLINYWLIAFATTFLCMILLVSAVNKISQSRNYRYFFHIAVLYFFYYLGRAGSIYRYWKIIRTGNST